jgi:hypothetical protein
MFNASITEMGFNPTIADPDVYQQAITKLDGFKYYKFILMYVDDVLIISHSPQEHLEHIKATYELNLNSTRPPTGNFDSIHISDLCRFSANLSGEGFTCTLPFWLD